MATFTILHPSLSENFYHFPRHRAVDLGAAAPQWWGQLLPFYADSASTCTFTVLRRSRRKPTFTVVRAIILPSYTTLPMFASARCAPFTALRDRHTDDRRRERCRWATSGFQPSSDSRYSRTIAACSLRLSQECGVRKGIGRRPVRWTRAVLEDGGLGWRGRSEGEGEWRPGLRPSSTLAGPLLVGDVGEGGAFRWRGAPTHRSGAVLR